MRRKQPSTFFLSLALACSAAGAAEPKQTAPVPELLQRLAKSFPPGKYIPPQEFVANADVQQLLRLAKADVGAVLKAYQFGRGVAVFGFVVENPMSYEQFKKAPSRWRMGWAGKGKLVEYDRSRKGYDRYLAAWRERDQFRIQLTHKRRLITNVVAELARRDPQVALGLLGHEDPRVRMFTIRLLRLHQGLRSGQVIRALLAMAPQRLPGKEYLSRAITVEDDIAIELARILSHWQVREALPYVRKLGEHPHYHIRSESLQMMNRYGYRDAIPHAIARLEDQVYVTRGEAFMNLVKLTALVLGQSWELWGQKATREQIAAAAEKWRAWWATYRKANHDATFHAEVIERIFRLMDLSLRGRPREPALVSPEYLLRQHLDLSSLEALSRKPAERAAQLRAFWKERRGDLRWDPRSQRFVLRGPGGR